jgi:hypothetical protein
MFKGQLYEIQNCHHQNTIRDNKRKIMKGAMHASQCCVSTEETTNLLSRTVVHCADYSYKKEAFVAGESVMLTLVIGIITEHSFNYALYHCLGGM